MVFIYLNLKCVTIKSPQGVNLNWAMLNLIRRLKIRNLYVWSNQNLNKEIVKVIKSSKVLVPHFYQIFLKKRFWMKACKLLESSTPTCFIFLDSRLFFRSSHLIPQHINPCPSSLCKNTNIVTVMSKSKI